jgi:urease accessory protein
VPGLDATLAPTAGAAIMPLAGPGMLATAVGPDIRSVQGILDAMATRAAEAALV